MSPLHDHRPRSQSLKRAFDVCFASLGLLFSAPLWVLIAVCIKLEDGGPVFYGQKRVGKNGVRFTSWKFRSMVADADKRFGPLQAQQGDARVTRVGRCLRATALDELPQLWNILLGEMSFVGPRALLPAEIEAHGNGELVALAEIPGYETRHQITPGLTGIAQVYASRTIPRRYKFKFDHLYIKKRTFWLDVKLIAFSCWVSLQGKWEYPGGKLPRCKSRDRGQRDDTIVRPSETSRESFMPIPRHHEG